MNESIELLKGAYDCLLGSPSNEEVILLTDCIRQYLNQPQCAPMTQREAYLRGYATARKDYKQKVINAFGVDDE